MIARLRPDPDQVRMYLRRALNGFDTLNADDAVELARADACSLLDYLRLTDDAVLVTGIRPIEPGVWHERSAGKPDIFDLVYPERVPVGPEA